MTWLAGVVLSGIIPAALPAPTRIVWITAAGNEASAGCTLQSPDRWTCDQLPVAAQGLIVIVDVSGALAYLPLRLAADTSGGVTSAGRVVQIVAGSAAPE